MLPEQLEVVAAEVVADLLKEKHVDSVYLL